MLSLLLSEGYKDFENLLNPIMWHGIHWIALADYSPMCQGFNYFSGILHHFDVAKLATSSLRVNKKCVFNFDMQDTNW